MSETDSAGGKRGLRSDRVSGFVFVVIALLVGWENRAYPLGSMSEPGPGFLPLAYAVMLGVFGIAIALQGGASTFIKAMHWTESRRAVALLIACGFAVFALERIGYRLTMIALLVFLIGVVERKGWLATLSVAVGFAFVSHFVVATLLKVQLPKGPLGL